MSSPMSETKVSKKANVKKNDQVLVIAGKNRGTTARVMKVFPSAGTALVERVNLVKRHTRANPQRQVQGGILEKEAPIRIANVMVVCPSCGKPSRLGRSRSADGKSIRICKKCGATLN